MRRILALSLASAAIALGTVAPSAASAASTSGFSAGYSSYHTYAETEAQIDQIVADHPAIALKIAIGESHEGRTLWALKVSDNVDRDEREPEVLFESLHHAREHLTVEMALHIAELLTDGYGYDQRITDIVRSREVWIVPMVNPDGGEWDISDPNGDFRNWRKNRQPIPGSSAVGIDLNRNWGYRWGCCNGSSGKPAGSTYRGQFPWQAPEVVALRDFVLGRVVDGRQQIRAAISWHSFNEEIMWPYAYTMADLPRTMSRDDLLAFRALGEGMAARNSYTPQQMSDLYVMDGTTSDWLYGDQRIFAFTLEMYPTDGSRVGGFYPPDGVIERETARNVEAVLYFLEHADCPYRAAGLAETHCGPLNDDFEASRGWIIDPFDTDTATGGAWERGIPRKSRNAAGVKQRAYGYSGQSALVTGALRGSSVNANDLDGLSSVLSPSIRLGGAGSTGWRLSFRYAFAHNARARATDFLRISVDGTQVFTRTGVAANRNATWTPVTVDLDAFAGQSVRLLIEAADGGSDSLVEAVVDDVRIYQLAP